MGKLTINISDTAVNLDLADAPRKKAAVISHERSGTHFLMNTLALNFGYVSEPWWNFDFNIPLNFHAPECLQGYLAQADNRPALNILKSHHSVGFFVEFMEHLASHIHVFYICRDPRDVLVSNWKLVNEFEWDEGPKAKTASEFIRSTPSGAMMRFQKQPEPNQVTRWETHVKGWLDFEQANPDVPVVIVRYEDLSRDFEAIVEQIGQAIGEPVGAIRRPAASRNVIGSGPAKVAGQREHLTPADETFIRQHCGATMKRLGYVD